MSVVLRQWESAYQPVSYSCLPAKQQRREVRLVWLKEGTAFYKQWLVREQLQE